METNKMNNEYENLQRKVNGDKKRKKRYLEVDEGEKVVGWVGSFVEIIHTYGMKKVLQAIFLIVSLVTFLMFMNALDNKDIVENFIENSYKNHSRGFDIRKDVNPKINNEILRLLYESDGDRVSVMEMHNGKENPTSLPFKYCEMTYEQTKRGIPYVSEEYSSLNMSRYMFFSYLYERKIFLGKIEEVYEMDRKLAAHLDANRVKYFGIILLNTNVDIGFLVISFEGEPKISKDELTSKLISSSHVISNLLDYVKQSDLRKIENNEW